MCSAFVSKMFRMSFTNLVKQNKEIVNKFLNSFDTVLTDCDGVLWLENEVIEGSPEVINTLKDMGKKVFYVTNNSTKTRDDYLKKFAKMNYKGEKNDIISTSYLAAQYLKNVGFKGKAYVMAQQGMIEELRQVGIESIGTGPDNLNMSLGDFLNDYKAEPEVGAVVVGYDEHFNYIKMLKAATYLKNPDVIFVGTNTDEQYPNKYNLIVPGTGTIVTAVKTAAQREPCIVGKPETYMANFIKNEYGINPERTLMIGDRCNTDILFGTRNGFQTMLVLSGITSFKEVEVWKQSKSKDDNDLVPDVYLNTLGDLLPFLIQN